MRASTFFSDEQKKLIVSAIEEAEKNTSGEIRVHVEMRCHGDIMKRAEAVIAIAKKVIINDIRRTMRNV